jgi:hypothetical protein
MKNPDINVTESDDEGVLMVNSKAVANPVVSEHQSDASDEEDLKNISTEINKMEISRDEAKESGPDGIAVGNRLFNEDGDLIEPLSGNSDASGAGDDLVQEQGTETTLYKSLDEIVDEALTGRRFKGDNFNDVLKEFGGDRQTGIRKFCKRIFGPAERLLSGGAPPPGYTGESTGGSMTFRSFEVLFNILDEHRVFSKEQYVDCEDDYSETDFRNRCNEKVINVLDLGSEHGRFIGYCALRVPHSNVIGIENGPTKNMVAYSLLSQVFYCPT